LRGELRSGSFAWLAGGLDFAAMVIDNGFGDGMAQPIAAVAYHRGKRARKWGATGERGIGN